MLTALKFILAVALGTTGVVLIIPYGHAADPKERSKEIIAVQLRRQGYECNKPQSAERDDAASKPDAEIWTLNCEGVSYRVKLIPNMAATVEKLPDDQQSTQQP